MPLRTCIFSCICFCISLAAFAQDTAMYTSPDRSNSAVQQEKPYVIMISIDGCRYDYPEKYHTANLLRLSGNGVKAKAMQPSFPSLTFPNHYSLVTGLYPAHHGLVDNSFYDRSFQQEYRTRDRDAVENGKWYGGTPLWVLAEQQQMISASYFWVGSEAAIQGMHPTYYFRYNERTGIDQRIQQVVDWLSLPADKRPHLITFYFPEVDHAGHVYGPDSDSTRAAVQWVDDAIGKMATAVAALKLPVNFIVVSDHGMMQADTIHPISVPKALLPEAAKISASNEKIMIYDNDSARILSTYQQLKAQAQHYHVLLKNETPARWHYGQEDRYNRIGDIVLLADAGYAFSNNNNHHISPGHHGYDNNDPRMQAIFMAWGPAFKQHYKQGTFANIHVYPLVTSILGLTISGPIDGDPAVLKNALQP